jgi:hypothetical protein
MPKTLPIPQSSEAFFAECKKAERAAIQTRHRAGRPVESAHLLGSVTRYLDREFNFLADVTSLDWADGTIFSAKGARLAQTRGGVAGGGAMLSSWEEFGSMLLEVSISPFNQVIAKGTWVLPVLPTDDEVFAIFTALLDAIEAA